VVVQAYRRLRMDCTGTPLPGDRGAGREALPPGVGNASAPACLHQGVGIRGLCRAASQRPAGPGPGDRPNAADDLTNDDIAAATQLRRRAQLDIKHPQNTGPQMNQVTMMFFPLRFITRIEVRQEDQIIWTMDGGMTLSENPRIAFDYRVNGAGRLRVRAEDTRYAVWEQSFPIGSSS